MGALLSLMFVSIVMFFAGIVLIIVSSESVKKFAFYVVLLAIFIFICCISWYPHAKDSYYYDEKYQETNDDYQAL